MNGCILHSHLIGYENVEGIFFVNGSNAYEFDTDGYRMGSSNIDLHIGGKSYWIMQDIIP